jgi:outer membrane protein TolC
MKDKAAALQEYEDALTEYLAQARSAQRGRSNLELANRLYEADMEIERHGVRDTPEYKDAVLGADTRAWASHRA